MALVRRLVAVLGGKKAFSKGSLNLRFLAVEESNLHRAFTSAAKCSNHGQAAVQATVFQTTSVASTSGSSTSLGWRDVIRHYGQCYYELSKFRLSALVVSTASAGYILGSGEVIDLPGLGWISLGTMLAAASANAFNQVIEVANDSRMKRTMRRPLPSGRLSRGHALIFASSMGLAGVTLLAYKTNALTAELGAADIALYALAYTPLKQISIANTWLGAVVGAIPPLMGWAAASGQLDLGSGILAAALYFWQLPHFMALAYLCRHDYAAGGYRMLSLVDQTGKRLAAVSLRNCLYLVPLGFLAHHCGVTSQYFTAENILLAGWLGLSAAAFYRHPSPETAKKMFRGSLLYLPLLMGAMILHRRPNPNLQRQRMPERTLLVEAELHKCEQEKQSSQRTQWSAQQALLRNERALQEARRGVQTAPLPPVAFLSSAPFPFLPAPEFGASRW